MRLWRHALVIQDSFLEFSSREFDLRRESLQLELETDQETSR